ncbi:MAG TPA: phenylalanine--tRNA ligase subunit beta, partial [Dongiaceae bacterium]|nr:phenylalanine--tRNA ligase subunit beta [Dongiaceae bacterium]
MKLPMSWLREWVTLDAGVEAAAVADALTRRGFYVEGVETHGRAHPGVVVARVLEVVKHPNADKLSLCRVDGGAGELRVVCGAPNVRAGMMVPLATIGATLPGGITIKKSKIRGEESQGMLCSPRELELSEDHQGILDLETWRPGRALTPGAPFDALLPPPDAVLEIEIPFNRPDGLGIVGLAREVKAAFGAGWSAAARAVRATPWTETRGFDLKLEDREGCPHYLAQVVENVRIGPSPDWLQTRLETMGQRPINNVVDLTNLVLLELGQPMHAFDLAKLDGPAIGVRPARAGERLTTLDGRERALESGMLVIADRRRPVALAGVMGGADSEVTAATTTLLLECAWFAPTRVRRTARALGLATEASKRFERGVDPGIADVAAARFLALLAQASPGCRVTHGARGGAPPPGPAPLTLRPARWRRLLGTEVGVDEAVRVLESFDLEVTRGAALQVKVPGWRPDLTAEDDLVEEVARGHGYDHIPARSPETHGVRAERRTRERVIDAARHAMIARGFTEAWCSSLVSEREALDAIALLTGDPTALVRLHNPMSREGEFLRPNLVPGLLRALSRNLKQGAGAVRLFEVGSGFTRSTGAGTLGVETPLLAAVVTGPRWAHAHDASQAMVDWDDAKGLWEAWFEEMSVDTLTWRTYSAAGWKPGASAEVARMASRIAWAGTLAQQTLRRWDIETPGTQPVHLFVALLDPLIEAAA